MALLDLISLVPRSSIGAIEIAAAIEEVLTDSLEITEHPVETGAAITDHAFKKPQEVALTCGWSNSSLLEAPRPTVAAVFSNGSMTRADYVSGVYSLLLALQESRVPFDVFTTKRQYQNMLITGLSVTTDAKTSEALMVQATLRQVIIVRTQATTLPPRADQADPASTAEIENAGVKQVQPATPSPGGSLPVR